MTAQDKLAEESNNKETSDSLPEESNKETSDPLLEGTTTEGTKNACSDDDTITKKSSPDVDYENKAGKAPHPTQNSQDDESPEAQGAGKKGRPKFNFVNEIKINRKLLPIKIAMFCFRGKS